MELPFSRQELEQLLVSYNDAIWPAQWGLYAVALMLAAIPFLARRSSAGALLWPLGGLWVWSGVVYIGLFLKQINPAAPVFMILFLVQAIMLWRRGWQLRELRFRRGGGWPWAAAGLLLLALVLYPAWHSWQDPDWPVGAFPGLPLPTVLVTVALLAMLDLDNLRGLLVIPLLWVFVGVATAVELALWPDLALLAGAAVAVRLIVPPRASASVAGPD